MTMRKISILLILLAYSATAAKANTDGFKWIKEFRYEQIRPYSDNLSAFKQNGLWGYIDKAGNIAIEPSFEECGDFSHSIAIAKQNGKWGIIDTTGACKSGFFFDEMSDFSDGISLAKEGNNFYYVYPDGKRQLLSSKFQYGQFSENLAPVMNKKTRKWGYINRKGIVTIEPKYDTVSNFSNGIAMVENKGKKYYINLKGNKKNIQISEVQPLEFINGYAKIHINDGVGFMNDKFENLPTLGAEATDFNKDGIAALLMKNNTMIYINGSGKTELYVEYDKIGNFSEGLAWVSKNDKYGYINRKGELVIDTVFTSATDFSDGIAFVTVNSRFGSIKLREEGDSDPVLSIDEIMIKDANLNNTVEAEERFSIALSISNRSQENMENINILLASQQNQQQWFDYDEQSVNVPLLKANSDTTVFFSGKAKLDLVSEDINLEFRGLASNMYQATKSPFSFKALGVNACKPIIAKYWAFNTDHSPIKIGDKANLWITIKNDGSDLAKDVTVNLQWPEGILGYENELKIPMLSPGEETVLKTYFAADSLKSESEMFTVVAKLSEYTQKHKDIKYLSFYTGKMNAEVNTETGSQMMYQYFPDPQYMAQNAVPVNTPQVVMQGAAGNRQEIVKENTSTSELMAGLQNVNATDPNKFALVIGNEDYNSFKQSATYEVNVDYAVQDATAFAAYATSYLGVPKENVILLKNATYAQMNFNLNKLMMMTETNPGNVELYIFYAGHGQHDVDSKETYLVPVDVSISSPTAGIKLDKLYADLGKCQAKRTMVFMDACYSGVGRGIVIKPKEAPVKGNTIVFTATSSTQRSMPYQDKKHGLFTYFLLKTIKDVNGQISVEHLYDKVRKEVVKNSIWINNSEQTPELINGEGIDTGWENWSVY